MKVVEPPNRFFPKRAYATEDVNRNLSHAANMIRNDQDERYVYTSVRVPLATISGRQSYGPAPDAKYGSSAYGDLEANSRIIENSCSGAAALCPNNHEGLRTFAFVPPWDMKIVSSDLYVVCNTDEELYLGAGTDPIQITDNHPMVVKLQWIADDGGEGYPARPKSYLPEGLRYDKDPDLYRIHDQITIDVTAKGGYFSLTDNTELVLRGGRCYRLCVSDPDIPSISKNFGFKPEDLPNEYDLRWFWRYDAAWVQLNFQYDKWKFDELNRPDVTFFTADNAVERSNTQDTGISDQLESLDSHRQATTEKRRYPKAELFSFGLGNFSGMWNRPYSDGDPTATVGPGNDSLMTDQANSLSAVTSHSDSWYRHAIPDLDYRYNGEALPGPAVREIMDARYAHNFQYQTAWRYPVSPLTPGVLDNKKLYGYSVGLMHNTSPDFWQKDPAFLWNPAMPPQAKMKVRHYGYDWHCRLGHGLAFDGRATNIPDNYSVYNGSETDEANNKTTPKLTENNSVTGGGLDGVNPIGLGWNNTPWASTSIPLSLDSSEKHYGVASGFPGDYLSEIHSGPQYGKDPDNPTIPLSSLSTSSGNFVDPEVSHKFPMDLGKLNDEDDLFLILNTFCSSTSAFVGTPGSLDWDNDLQRRNFQKVYVLMWVM